MSISHKTSSSQVFRLMVYRRPLHPELFNLQGRQCHAQAEYEVETWITPGGHVVRFQNEESYLTETVIESGDHLPEAGLIHALPCLGEKDFQLDHKEHNLQIGYVTTIQTEMLTENLFLATYKEMREFANESCALEHERRDQNGSLVYSVLDVQKYKKEFHLQSYHMFGANGLVLRTQSIFEVV